jgi:ribose/xylose/arabinose/galactoside ABC-type transport system permease subunit
MPGKLDPAVTTQGQGIIFSAFAAAVIGGVSLGGVSLGGVSLGGVSPGGGRGTMMGLVSGVLLIGVINNLLMLAQVPQFHVQARTGAVIIIAAVLTTIASRRSSGVKTLT